MPNVNGLGAEMVLSQASRREPASENTVFELQGPALQAARRAEEISEIDPKIRKSAQDFEAFFIGHLLKDMRKSLPEGGLFEQSSESRMMHDMLDESMADDLAHKGPGIGLAQVLMKQLHRSRS